MDPCENISLQELIAIHREVRGTETVWVWLNKFEEDGAVSRLNELFGYTV